MHRVITRAGLSHLAARDLEGALAASQRLAERGFAVILGYWDAPGDTPAQVESLSLAAVEAIAASGLNGYLSLKPAALGFARNRIEAIVDRATGLGVPVHFDSTGPEDAEPGWKLLSELARPELGCTLPSRWRRSLADAERAVELGLRVRIVKGQWPDPDDPSLDDRSSFLALADALASRVKHVGVATHDAALAVEALGRLAAAGTHVEHELMFGLPRSRQVEASTRVYVPFGHPSLPYAPGRARRNVRVAGWLGRDLVRGLARRGV
jgi:proline dehydrogenase